MHEQPQTGADYCQHGVPEVNSVTMRLETTSKTNRETGQVNCAFHFRLGMDYRIESAMEGDREVWSKAQAIA